MSQDDAIPLHYRRPRYLDHFRVSAQGWYNPTMFSRTKVTRSIVDRCPRMIQSLFILEDRGLRITLGQMPRDDTIPLQHHYSPFQGRSVRTTPGLSRKCSNSTRGRGFVSTSSNHHHLHLQYVNTESIIISIFSIRNHHHLYLQYVNTEISSISSVWEYWNIIISIFNIEILNHHHLHL